MGAGRHHFFGLPWGPPAQVTFCPLDSATLASSCPGPSMSAAQRLVHHILSIGIHRSAWYPAPASPHHLVSRQPCPPQFPALPVAQVKPQVHLGTQMLGFLVVSSAKPGTLLPCLSWARLALRGQGKEPFKNSVENSDSQMQENSHHALTG